MIDVAVLVPVSPDGTDPWIGGALEAAERLRAAGVQVEVIPGMPEAMPDAAVTICHGVQYEPLLAGGSARPVIVSDLLSAVAPGPVTTIDWCWAQAAADAARAVRGLGARRLGLVAGPPVPTQRKVLAAFADAASSMTPAGDAGATVCAVHLPAFDDVEAGRVAGALLHAYGCTVVAHSADAAGAAAVAAARERGAATLGFLAPAPEDIGWIDSDIAGALASLACTALAGRTLPSLFRADEASGYGGFRRGPRFGDVTMA